jgi:cytochrome P450
VTAAAHTAPASARPAYVDTSRNAWVLSLYADVRAALAEPRLVVHGTPTASAVGVLEDMAMPRVPELPTHWRTVAQQEAERMVDALPLSESVDLVAQYFAPWSLAVARHVIGVSQEASDHCLPVARTVFLEAAHATDGAPTAVATDAAAVLAAQLQRGATTPWRATIVQAWVALTQSLPATLASMWSALLAHPEQYAYVRGARHDEAKADVMSRAVAELLRFAGPAQAVFRTADANVAIGGAEVRANDRVILLLSAANRDSSHLPDADRLDVTRTVTSHLALGAGPHRCPGASLVRMTTAIAMEALVRRAPHIALDRTAVDSWIGGFAIRAPLTVWATISSRGNEERPAGGC